MPISQEPLEVDIFFNLMESWLHVVSHERNQKSYFSSEQSENELRSQNDIQKKVLRKKIDFFKSLFQKFLEIICIKVQLVKYSKRTKDSGAVLI